jgi:hypothetical protein
MAILQQLRTLWSSYVIFRHSLTCRLRLTSFIFMVRVRVTELTPGCVGTHRRIRPFESIVFRIGFSGKNP